MDFEWCVGESQQYLIDLGAFFLSVRCVFMWNTIVFKYIEQFCIGLGFITSNNKTHLNYCSLVQQEGHV